MRKCWTARVKKSPWRIGMSQGPSCSLSMVCLVAFAAATAAAEPAAAAATAAAPATAEPAAAAATTAAAAATVFTWTSFIDGQLSAVDLFAVEPVDRRLSFLRAAHFHKPETLRATGVAIHDDLDRLHL